MDEALLDVRRLAIDTTPVIYFVEAHPRYDTLVTDVFQRIADGRMIGVTSTVTLCEVLVQPVQQNDDALQQSYLDLILHSANFEVHYIDAAIAVRAAALRARHRLRTPDALQVAVALNAGCEAFLTNDIALQRVTELRVLVLDQLRR